MKKGGGHVKGRRRVRTGDGGALQDPELGQVPTGPGRGDCAAHGLPTSLLR